MPELAVVLLGAGAVGKSAISIQFVQGHFCERYDSTIEDIYRRPIEVDGDASTLTVVDTAGQEAFNHMKEPYMRSGQAFILVFSITDSESLQKLKVIYAQLVRVRGENTHIPCVVVGNKTDLAAQRAVPSEQGKEFARFSNSHYFEISAKDKGQVDEVFTHVVRLVRRGSAAPAPGLGAAPGSGGVGGAGGDYQSRSAGQGGAQHGGESKAAAANQAAAPAASVTPALKKRSFFDRCSIM